MEIRGCTNGRRSALICVTTWLAALLLMLLFLGTPPVQRTQEARVLETAREMLGRPWHDWMIPQLNGQVRLAKPPLAYWLAAGAFKVAGVSDRAGRVPFVIAGWLTLLVTWLAAKWLFGPRAAWYAAAVLAGTLMFARHARLAETDILATLFVSAGIYCIWRGADRSKRGSTALLALSGVMIALAALAKGLPAIFAIVFLLGWAAASRDWRLILRWIKSGAPLLLLIVAAPWFAYVHESVGLKTIQDEADIGVAGLEHAAPIYLYIPDTLRAIAPWTALTIFAVALAARQWKADLKVRGALVWLGAIALPLCIAKQRQFHYLLPVMPPFALLTGWLIDRALSGELPAAAWSRLLLTWTSIVGVVAAIALLPLAHYFRGHLAPIDGLFVAGGMLACAITLACCESPARQTQRFAIGCVILVTLTVQVWMPSLRTGGDPRTVAAQIRAIGPGPYCFYGDNLSLPLVFYIGQTMPQLTSSQQLSDAIAKSPSTIVVAQTKSGRAPPPVPVGLERAAEISAGEQTFEVYRAANR